MITADYNNYSLTMRHLVIALLISTSLLYAQQASITKQPQTTCDLGAMAKSADVIVIAISNGTVGSPGFWSRYTPATQQVSYTPDQWLKGTLQTSPLKIGTFTVEHDVVYETATADGNEAKLKESLFAKGNKLILFLNTRTVRLAVQLNSLPLQPPRLLTLRQIQRIEKGTKNSHSPCPVSVL